MESAQLEPLAGSTWRQQRNPRSCFAMLTLGRSPRLWHLFLPCLGFQLLSKRQRPILCPGEGAFARPWLCCRAPVPAG